MPDNAAKILVAEDEAALRDLYIQILTDAGFSVTSAADGQQAYDAMYQGGFDLVLLDIIMPVYDGLSIIQKLTDQTPPKLPNKRIVILSNLGQEESIGKAMTLGAQGYLIKSDYNPAQIVEQVKKFLSQDPPPTPQAAPEETI